ncbi:Receptor expression enhancing protein B [Carabus blaptoides fortunei]
MAAKIQELKSTLERTLRDESKPWTKTLLLIEEKTGVDRLYIFLGFIAFTGIYLIFGYGAQLVCNTIGFLYPAYTSMRAIESPQKDDDTKWLTYWVVFALFSVVEFFADMVAGWFPLYWLLKCLFMVWLMMPTDFNGSLVLYNRVIRPYFLKHHGAIDSTLQNLKDSAIKISASSLKSD